MSLLVAQAVLEDVQAAVEPVEADMYREEEVSIPFVWVRAPDTISGPVRSIKAFKNSFLYVDLWTFSWRDMDELEAELAFLDGFVVADFEDAHGIRYGLNTANRIQESDSVHSMLTYGVSYIDGRVIA